MLCAFLAAYDLTNNPAYIHAAEYTFGSFTVPVSAGGVATFENDIAWYEEVADEGAPSSKILNGHISALAALWTFWKWTGDADVKHYLDIGIAAVRRDIALYDAGVISYYSQYPTNPRVFAPQGDYNTLHVQQLLWLYEITAEPVFLEYALCFASYDAPAWEITAAGSTDPVGHGPDNLFFQMGNKYWSHNKFPTWVQLDLGMPQVIEGLALFGHTANATPRDFQVFVSEDSEKWRLVLEKTENKKQFLIERFDPVPARFVKLVILNDNGNKNVALTGVAVLMEATVPMAVSDWQSFCRGNLPTRVFNYGWRIPESGWIVVDLGDNPQDIVIDMINFESQCSFSIFGTNDLKNFNAIALPEVQPTKDGFNITIHNVSSHHLKIKFIKGCKGGKLLIRRS